MLFWLVFAAPFTIVGLVFTAIGLVQQQLLFCAIGSASLAVGLAAIGYALVSRRRARRIRETGRKVRARVVGVERNHALTFNGQPAWRVAAEWRDGLTGETFSGLGENIFFDPARWLGPEIDVFIDRDNPQLYLVDVEAIRAARRGRPVPGGARA